MSRAAYYPPANRTAQRFDGAYKGSSMSPNCLVLHTTEGTSWPSYSGGAVAPHLTALPDWKNEKLIWRQHFPVTMSARALVNRAGGVQTNTANCIQIELVGTSGWASSENKYADYHLGDKWYWAKHATDWMLRDVAAFIRWCHTEWGIPYSAPYAFDDWRGNHSHRMSNAQWRAFEGVCGHSHVPENSHTDPGAFPIAACLRLAAGGTTTTIQEDDMPSVSDIWNGKLPFKATPADDRLTAGRLLDEAATQATYATNHARAAEAGIKGAQVQLHKDNTTTQNSIANVRSDVAKLGSDVADIKAAIAALAEKIGG